MLDALYQKDILRLARASKSRGKLENPDTTARVNNPLCGDQVTMDFALSDGTVHQVGCRVRGCALCEASAEILAGKIVGLKLVDVVFAENQTRMFLIDAQVEPPWPQLSLFKPVRAIKSRHECVLLPFSAAKNALQNARSVG